MTRPWKNVLKFFLTAAGIMLVAIGLAATGGSEARAGPNTSATHVIVDNPSLPVNVNNAPSVTLAGSPIVSLTPNSADTAYFVKNGSRTPYQLSFSFNLQPGGNANATSSVASVDKWFVIEQVSVVLYEQTQTAWAALFNLSTSTQGSTSGTSLPLTVVGTFSGTTTALVATAPVKMYNPPGGTLFAILNTNSSATTATADGSCLVNVSGYLTDAP